MLNGVCRSQGSSAATGPFGSHSRHSRLASLGAASAKPDCSADPAPGVDWTECDKKLIILSGSDFNGATLVGTDFTSTDLRDSNLLAANFEKATLVRASLAGSKADGAKFDRIEAYRTNFSGMSAQGATFASAEMQRSNFTGAKLVNVDFTKAELGRAEFADAEIIGSQVLARQPGPRRFHESQVRDAARLREFLPVPDQDRGGRPLRRDRPRAVAGRHVLRGRQHQAARAASSRRQAGPASSTDQIRHCGIHGEKSTRLRRRSDQISPLTGGGRRRLGDIAPWCVG